jgi:hypothetical protein
VSWPRLARLTFFTLLAVLFVGSMVGILLTGPVVVRVPPLEPRPGVSAQRLRETVDTLCFGFGPRDHLHPDNLERVADWIGAELSAAGLAVQTQEYALAAGRFRNVIGHRPGSDPSAAIVIGAHYDAHVDSPGADDNASGVAVLLELARTLPDGPHRNSHILVAFGTEEPPFFGTDGMGSYRFAQRLVADRTDVRLMISLDLVGYYSDEPGSQLFPHPLLRLLFPDRGDFVAILGDLRAGPWIDQTKRGIMAAGTIDVHSLRAPASWFGVHMSDHWSFRQLGLPGVHVTDTAFMRFTHYHTAEDTPDKLDYERMAALVQGLHGVLVE